MYLVLLSTNKSSSFFSVQLLVYQPEMAQIAELPDVDLVRTGFDVNANALDIVAQQLQDAAGIVTQQLYGAAAANREIAVQVSPLPQAPMLQGHAIVALIQILREDIQGMRKEFRARFVK